MFTGKSLVSKERAVGTKADDGSCQVYYISLVASTRRGIPRRLLYLFDYLTEKIDFKDTGVETINTTKLLKHFNKHHPTHKTFYDPKEQKIMMKHRSNDKEPPSTIDVYMLVKFFIKDVVSKYGEKAAFIIDECPIISNFERVGKQN